MSDCPLPQLNLNQEKEKGSASCYSSTKPLYLEAKEQLG